MSVGTKSLVTKVDGCTASTVTNLNAARFAAIHNSLNTCIADKFATCAALPTAFNNTGRLVYIESICSYRYSDGTSWTSDFDNTLIYDNNIYTWGSNCDGYNNLATRVLASGGTVTYGRCSPATIVGGRTNWCAIGDGASCTHRGAIGTDGTLWMWGDNSWGQLGTGTGSTDSPVTVLGGGTTWTQISTGQAHTLAIKTDGTLWTWGRNTWGELGDDTVTCRSSPGTVAGGGTTWCQAEAGFSANAGIKTDGTLWTWGRNVAGELGDGTTTCRSSPGTTAGGGTTWCQVNSKNGSMAAIQTDRTLWTWGCNSYGQLGDGTIANRSSPVTVAGGGTTWCQVSAGCYNTSAIKTDGTLWTWGAGTRCFTSTGGMLGNGTTTNRSSPGTTAGGGTNWWFVSTGSLSVAAIKTDGTLWTWGHNSRGALGDGTTTTRSSPGTVAGNITSWVKVNVAAGYNRAQFNYPFGCTRDHMAAMTLNSCGFNAAA